MDEAARRASLERLLRSQRPRILFVSHGHEGGVTRHVEELGRALEGDAEVLLLRPRPGGLTLLTWMRRDEPLRLHFDTQREWGRLQATLAALGIDRVHYHHVDGHPRDVLGLAAHLAVPYDVTIHDYFAACANYHMLDGTGRFCGGEPGCRRCLDAGTAPWAMSIEEWRAAFGKLLGAAARVIAPSADAARRIAAFFPEVSPVTWPHPEDSPPSRPAPVRVLVPGAISIAKGLEVLEACVADAAGRGLGLHFRVLGFVARAMKTWPEAPLSISGEFPPGRLAELIALEGGDVVFFPAQCPEIFSYTLSAALDSGLPIVATGIGALPERLAASPRARVVPWDSSPATLNDALVSAGARAAQAPAARPRVGFDDYLDRYREALPKGSVSRTATPPTIEAHWLREPPEAPDRRPLAFFYEDGVVCGRRSSLEGLRRYAFDPDSLHAAADARVRELIEALEAERAKPAESPLRALARKLRGAKS